MNIDWKVWLLLAIVSAVGIAIEVLALYDKHKDKD